MSGGYDMASCDRQVGITTAPSGSWVQTERKAHEKWAQLISNHPKSAALMHLIIAHMGRHNALVASQATLATMLGCTVRTIQRALEPLRDGHWLEVRSIGATGSASAYIVNSRVAWTGSRDGLRHSLFDATVLVSEVEQPDRDQLEHQEPLQRLPDLAPGEQQLPTGEGLPPVSQPSFLGLEPDLPARGAKQPKGRRN